MGLLSKIASFFYTRSEKPDYTEPREGTGGVQNVGDFLSTAEKSPKLNSIQNKQKTYDEMCLNVAIVATGLRYFSSLISGIKWTAKPPAPDKDEGDEKKEVKVDPEAKKYARIVQRNMEDMEVPWYRVVRCASQFKWTGFSIQETIAARMDWIEPGYIGIGTVENRPQATIEKWFLEKRSNIVLGWEQREPNTGEFLPLSRDKCIYVHDDTLTNSPDGVGVLRHVVQLCDELKRLEQLEGWAYETDLRGVPVGRAPTAILDDWVAKKKITPERKAELLAGLSDFIQNHLRNPQLGLLLDSSPYTGRDQTATPSAVRMWDIELVKGQGIGLAEICVAIERKQHEIARALGIEQFMLGAQGKGSLALSEDKTRNLIELINSTVSEIAWALDRDWVYPIYEMNRWDVKKMCKLIPDAVALRSISVIVECLGKLALAGATIDRNDPIINQIRSILHLVDQPFVTDEMKQETKGPNSGGKPGEKGPNAPKPTKET